MREHHASAESESTTDEYLTAHDVARVVKVSTPTVYRWRLDDPTMPALVVGNTVRFPAARLRAWLRAREQGRAR